MRARGFAIAEEFKVKGVHSVLGPVLANGRSVEGGTNFEGFGNDPFLIGAAGYETVIGHQAAGVQAEPKQYLGYDGQQFRRNFYSSNIDDKTMHEIEVWPYAEAVRAGAACVMVSYPQVNNTWVMQNAYLINNILKTHLAFQGYTQTDWDGLHSGVTAILAGIDQDMPGELYFGANYTLAVQNGSVPLWRLDDAAVRIMTPYFWLGQDRNYPQTNINDNPRNTIVNAQRHRHLTVAHEVACAGMVLLKNTQGKKGLPLGKPLTITLFGPAAGQNRWGPNQYTYGQNIGPDQRQISYTVDGRGANEGTVAEGGGSGTTFCKYSQFVVFLLPLSNDK
jgi:beta-glucosidase-like glycosyl hydrolase